MEKVISIISISILRTYNLYKKRIVLRKDSRWLSNYITVLKMRCLSKEPYCHEYEIPPSINGDFYKNGKAKYFNSPHRTFTILYNKCSHENSPSCVNCARRGQTTKYSSSTKKYCYGSSDRCYHISTINNK